MNKNYIQVYTFLYICDMGNKPTKKSNEKPFPVRLGELKPILQQEASQNDRSLHYWIRKILSTHCKIDFKNG